jgi:hypothetical protein
MHPQPTTDPSNIDRRDFSFAEKNNGVRRPGIHSVNTEHILAISQGKPDSHRLGVLHPEPNLAIPLHLCRVDVAQCLKTVRAPGRS